MALKKKLSQLTVLAAGYRGTAFVSGLLSTGSRPARIVSYPQTGDLSNALQRLSEICRSHKIPFEESRRPTFEVDEIVFVVGWQFILKNDVGRIVVFHDSLLPKLKGFSPTVTALLSGERSIGVTAFAPISDTDAGPVYGRKSIAVPPSATLQEMLELQTNAMVELAVELMERLSHHNIEGIAQDHQASTYSLWRDEFDYFIDWRKNADWILRQVSFLGFPYAGAKAVLVDTLLTIVKAHRGPDINFAIRDPGKLWQIVGGSALVVCGDGTLWIDEAIDLIGAHYQFRSLRKRFLTADTAWIAPFVSKQS